MLKPSFASGQRLVTGETVCKGDLSSSPTPLKGQATKDKPVLFTIFHQPQ